MDGHAEDNSVSRRGFLTGGLTVAAAATVAATALEAAGDVPGGPSTVLKVDFRRLVNRADLDYDKPASRSEEGMPIGNGRMGSLVWTTPEALHLQINRPDVHAAGCATNSFPRGSSDYASGCGYVDINFIDFGDDVFAGPLFHQHLDVYDAVMAAHGAGVSVRALASNDRDVIALEVEDRRSRTTPVTIDLRMLRYAMEYIPHRNRELVEQHAVMVRTNAHTATSRLDIRNGRIVLTQVFEEDEFYCASAVAIGVAGRLARARYGNESTVRLFAAPGKGRFTIHIASASSYSREQDVVAAALQALDGSTRESFDSLLGANQRWWHDYWSKGFLHLHSADGVADYVESNYTYFLYVMASSSRGAYPPRFGGMIWYTNGDMRQWGSEHWWNNDGCYYEGLVPANRFELLDPLFKMFSSRYENYALAAAQQWGSKGIWLPETTWFDGLEKLPPEIQSEMQELFLMRKPWEQRSAAFRRYEQAKQTFNSRWNFINHEGRWELGTWTHGDKGRGPFGHVTHILSTTAKISYVYWLRYDVSRDRAFLRDYAYPMLKGTVEFYRNFPNLKKEADGKYHIYHVNNHEGSWDAQDTQEEISAMRGITPLAIRASEILGVDAGMRPVWQEFVDHLAPLPTNETVQARKAGEPVIWVAAATVDRPQRRPAQLPTAFYDLCTVATEDAGMAAIGKATYEASTAAGVNEKTPCNVLSRAAVSAAKLGRAEHVRYLVPNQLRRLAPETDDCDWAGVGKVAVMRNRFSMREGPGCVEYQRAGLASQALHTALLMDSPPAPGKDSVIHVFAAWPKEWDAEFTLAARGGFVVAAAMRNGEIEFIELKSQAGEEARVHNPWSDGEVALFRNGKPAEQVGGPLLKLATARDEVLLLCRKGANPAPPSRTVVV